MILFPELTKLINVIYYSNFFFGFMKYYKNNDNEKKVRNCKKFITENRDLTFKYA